MPIRTIASNELAGRSQSQPIICWQDSSVASHLLQLQLRCCKSPALRLRHLLRTRCLISSPDCGQTASNRNEPDGWSCVLGCREQRLQVVTLRSSSITGLFILLATRRLSVRLVLWPTRTCELYSNSFVIGASHLRQRCSVAAILCGNILLYGQRNFIVHSYILLYI